MEDKSVHVEFGRLCEGSPKLDKASAANTPATSPSRGKRRADEERALERAGLKGYAGRVLKMRDQSLIEEAELLELNPFLRKS